MVTILEHYARELEIISSSRCVSASQPLSEEEIVAGSIIASCPQYRMRKGNIAAMRRESTDLCVMARDAIKGAHLDGD
ncbi:hypothetical protein FS842_008882, partial [Serendipita sp. 407]